MKVHTYEQAFLWTGGIMLVVFMAALSYGTLAMGMHLPGRAGRVDPATVTSMPPFDHPGVTRTGPNQYQVVVVARAWSFDPAEIRVPAHAQVTFLATSTDVIHGFEVQGTRINMMLVPGQISRNTETLDQPGEHLLICHEYCGLGHQTMSGKVVVQ